MADKTIIRTTESNWLERALKCYTGKKEFTFFDDANLGLTEKDVISAISLIKAAKSKGGISVQNIVAALVAIGITAVGVWMVAGAIADPDPTSKLALLIGGGIAVALTGSLGTLAALGIKYEVKVNLRQGIFEIKPQ